MTDKRSRADRLELSARLDAIENWIECGLTVKSILTQIVSLGWTGTTRNARRYYDKALERYEATRNDPAVQHRKSLEELKRQVIYMEQEFRGTPNGMRAILGIIKEINKMQGTYPPAPSRSQKAPEPEPEYGQVPRIEIIPSPDGNGGYVQSTPLPMLKASDIRRQNSQYL